MSTSTPPTAQDQPRAYLADLGDSTLYYRIERRVIFDEHDEYDREGRLVRRFGKPELEWIAGQCNARDRKGVLSPLVFGHTMPNQPETAQPEPRGYARRYAVELDPRLGKHVIVTDYYIKAPHYDEARTYPGTSVELWPEDGIFAPIALLRRTPRLDIPPWTYLRSGGRGVIRYSREDNMPDPGIGGMAAPGPMNAMPAPPPAPPAPPGGDVDLDSYMRHCYSHPAAAKIYQKYSAGAGGSPLGDPAAPLGADMPPPPPPGAPPEQFARHYQQVAEAYARRLAGVERELRETHRRADLGRLAGEGYQFDLEQELADAADLAPAQYARHLDRIRTHYQRDVAAAGVVPVVAEVPGASGGPTSGPRLVEHGALTRDGMRAALAYQREHPEATYEAAREVIVKQYTRNGR